MARIGNTNKWKVEEGESMSLIAEEIGVPLEKLVVWNKKEVPDPDKIDVGQQLWLVDPDAMRKRNMDTSRKPRAAVPSKAMPSKVPEQKQEPPAKLPYSERFVVCVERVLGHEGGRADDSADPGGRTNYGISQFIFPRMQKDGLTKATDVWNITRDEATEAYHTYFWLPMRCDRRPAGVDYFLFDSAIQHGEGVARKFAKRCTDNLEFLRTEREEYYQRVITGRVKSGKYTKAEANKYNVGWLKRLNEVYEVACEDERV